MLYQSQSLWCARFQATESACNEDELTQRPRAGRHRPQEGLHDIATATLERPASTGAGAQQPVHQSAANATQPASQESRGAVPPLRTALDDSNAQCECSIHGNGLLSGVIPSANGSSADPWRHEAVLAAGRRAACCAVELDVESSAQTSLKQLESRSRSLSAAAGNTLPLEPKSKITAEEHCASQAGEAIGDYVMYRF